MNSRPTTLPHDALSPFRHRVRALVFALCAALPLLAACASLAAQTSRPNVLFIAVDDLRPELGCYGASWVRSPAIDRLAREGRLFLRHYVQVPTCGASRHALLTGSRPSTPRHLGNNALIELLPREEGARPESFAHLFRRAGYRTVSIGKISHTPDGRVFAYDGSGDGRLEMPFSWDEVGLPYGKWKRGWDAFFGYADGSGRVQGESPPLETADVPDDGYPDGLIADAAIASLRELKDRPFLLAIGFFKPHLPFNAPRRYYDLYDEATVPLSPNPRAPDDLDPRSLHASGELFGNYGGHPEGARHSEARARALRRAYAACVSYTDAQVGKVLAELERLDLAERTIVVLWGDHGWHLGDHGLWGKHSLFERALRSALIIRTPNMASPGRSAKGIVETVDLYPTLAELCGLATPDGLDGESFVPLLRDPEHPGKDGALSAWTRGGRALRTERWRLVTHPETEHRAASVELYDHESDPNETRNVAGEHPALVHGLRRQLEAGRVRLIEPESAPGVR